MIFVEDNSDQYILEYFNKPSKKILRADGKQDVVKKIKKENGSIGIIDFDDSINIEVSGMKKEEDHNHILLYNFRKSYLVVICPRLQNWLVTACQESNSTPSQFKLPDKVGEFHKAINKEFRKNQFVELLKYLKNNSQMFLTYRKLIDKINHKD